MTRFLLPLSLLLATACADQSYTPISDEDSADVACRSTDIEFADRGSETPRYELTEEAFVFEGKLDVADLGPYYEVSPEELIVHAPIGESFQLRIQSNELIERTNFLMRIDYREVGTVDWETLDAEPNSELTGESFLYVIVHPSPSSAELLLSYVNIGARVTNCELVSYSKTQLIDWDTSRDYEYRIRPFVKSGLGDLDGDNYAFRIEGALGDS